MVQASTLRRALLGLTLAAPLVAALPAPALACGGFFCAAQPVEQNAERILFEPGADGSTTAVIDIRYVGDSADFSWILPMPGSLTEPLQTVPVQTLQLLELATTPRIIPPETTCTRAPSPFGDESSGIDFSATLQDGGVDVTELPRVGPYDPVEVSSEDPDALVAWLRDHGYVVTEAMVPIIQDYVRDGFVFLAMQLAPDAGVEDIAPIRLGYPGNEPMIPLRLTAVASEPEMGVLVFIAANERWQARNWTNLRVRVDDVQADPRNGQNNYYPLLSWMIDDASGRAFVTEYADDSEETWASIQGLFLSEDSIEAQSWLQNLFFRRGYVTRLYTRVSGWEMTSDPSFRAYSPVEGENPDVDPVIDLSDRPAIEVCGPGSGDRFVPCGSTYCGVGALCAVDENDVEGCVCDESSVARAIQAPMGPQMGVVDTVVCQPAGFEFLSEVTGAANGPADPCLADSCGESGTCSPVNGRAACACEEGFAAFPDGVGGVTCRKAAAQYEPGQLLWSGCNSAGCGGACSTSSGAPSGAAALLLLFPTLIRRRRR